MNEAQRMVQEFHRRFAIAVADRPIIPDAQTAALRIRLIQEEFDELKAALETKDLPGIAKELADLLYVVYGTAVSYGIDMEPVFEEVHRSNMSKVGGYKREDGKWIKPPTYSPANIPPLLLQQSSKQTNPPCHALGAHNAPNHILCDRHVSEDENKG
ncbi:MAG: hypothetical protein D6690_14045 [Nitrospirae bacterium]|nr:MAG: hypothetical protein D6690_14045 [Nitrospirota bacterium]